MIKDICTIIRSQTMFYIDNELREDKKTELLGHLDECLDCQNYFDSESDLKSKICQKLKDSYICRCDVNNLKNNIQSKISEIINPK